jgi:hypothetical protein
MPYEVDAGGELLRVVGAGAEFKNLSACDVE